MTEQVVIVGPGRMGLALGAALRQASAVEHLIYFGRGLEPPPHPIFDDPEVEYRLGPQPVPGGTTALILAVPDHALSDVAADLARQGRAPQGCSALHLAGALSTDVLAPLHSAGYAVGSMHPLQAIADPWSAGDRLIGSGFALAGEPEALAAARRLASRLGGLSFVIPAPRRPEYHAAAVFGSNYLVTLTAAMVRLLLDAGVSERDAFPAAMPLLRGTLDNIEQLGVSAALTGPIARGDVETVRLHLARLSPDIRRLYCALGIATLELARAAGLDEERAAELGALLSEE